MAKQRSSAPMPPGQVNIIGQGTTIEGALEASSDVRVAGTIIGQMRVSGKTVITPEGEVNGEIRTTSGDIAGRVNGDLVAEERLVLKETARVEGSLYTSKLVIEEGALFTGSCDMSGALPPTDEKERQAPKSEEVRTEAAGEPSMFSG